MNARTCGRTRWCRGGRYNDKSIAKNKVIPYTWVEEDEAHKLHQKRMIKMASFRQSNNSDSPTSSDDDDEIIQDEGELEVGTRVNPVANDDSEGALVWTAEDDDLGLRALRQNQPPPIGAKFEVVSERVAAGTKWQPEWRVATTVVVNLTAVTVTYEKSGVQATVPLAEWAQRSKPLLDDEEVKQERATSLRRSASSRHEEDLRRGPRSFLGPYQGFWKPRPRAHFKGGCEMFKDWQGRRRRFRLFKGTVGEQAAVAGVNYRFKIKRVEDSGAAVEAVPMVVWQQGRVKGDPPLSRVSNASFNGDIGTVMELREDNAIINVVYKQPGWWGNEKPRSKAVKLLVPRKCLSELRNSDLVEASLSRSSRALSR